MKPKKDVLFLCQFFHPEYISSAQLPFDTAKALHDSGFRVDVLCGYPKEYYNGPQVPKKETISGIGIQRLSYLQPSRSHTFGRLVNYFSFTLSVLAHLGLPHPGRLFQPAHFTLDRLLGKTAFWLQVGFCLL